jgi:hypothetical protein
MKVLESGKQDTLEFYGLDYSRVLHKGLSGYTMCMNDFMYGW